MLDPRAGLLGWFGLFLLVLLVFRGLGPNQLFMTKLSPILWTILASKKAIFPLPQRFPGKHKPSTSQRPDASVDKFCVKVAVATFVAICSTLALQIEKLSLFTALWALQFANSSPNAAHQVQDSF
mgnify:CR=1 FL=1